VRGETPYSAANGIIHKNAAARKKAQMAKKYAAE